MQERRGEASAAGGGSISTKQSDSSLAAAAALMPRLGAQPRLAGPPATTRLRKEAPLGMEPPGNKTPGALRAAGEGQGGTGCQCSLSAE